MGAKSFSGASTNDEGHHMRVEIAARASGGKLASSRER